MLKIMFTFIGLLSLLIGCIGIFVPVLPTTPFVLLSAACFVRSNKTLFNWLSRVKIFKSYIENYQYKVGVSKRDKLISRLFLWGMMALSIYLVKAIWIKIVLLIIAHVVSIHIRMIKTRSEDNAENKTETSDIKLFQEIS